MVVEGIKGVQYAPMPPEMYKNSENTGSFPALFGLLNAENAIFHSKVLTRYTPETFFEEYVNFEIFCYLRHCGVIPVQSFRIHVRPTPSCLDWGSQGYSVGCGLSHGLGRWWGEGLVLDLEPLWGGRLPACSQ
jgi:hypothetical protein